MAKESNFFLEFHAEGRVEGLLTLLDPNRVIESFGSVLLNPRGAAPSGQQMTANHACRIRGVAKAGSMGTEKEGGKYRDGMLLPRLV